MYENIKASHTQTRFILLNSCQLGLFTKMILKDLLSSGQPDNEKHHLQQNQAMIGLYQTSQHLKTCGQKHGSTTNPTFPVSTFRVFFIQPIYILQTTQALQTTRRSGDTAGAAPRHRYGNPARSGRPRARPPAASGAATWIRPGGSACSCLFLALASLVRRPKTWLQPKKTTKLTKVPKKSPTNQPPADPRPAESPPPS